MAWTLELRRFRRTEPPDNVERRRATSCGGRRWPARHSSPIVWGDHVIVTSQVGDLALAGGFGAHPQLARDDGALAGQENPIGGRRIASGKRGGDIWLVVEAFRRTTGERLWEVRVKATGTLPEVHEKHNLATPTPVTDGEHVFAWFGNGQVIALDMAGRLVWSRHLGLEVPLFETQWGHGSSPMPR